MTSSTNLLVFTDLDGTLIDHDTYRWTAAQQALDRLRHLRAGLILASSKTAPEVSALQTELGLEHWPAIVENGAGLLTAQSSEAPDDTTYNTLRKCLAEIPHDLRKLYIGFGDLSHADIAELTGLSPNNASLAAQRRFSEPGLWRGTDTQKDAFVSCLLERGIIAQQGGRFLTLSFGGNKVDQMRKIIETYQPLYTIALGDAPNDIQMLEAADFGVIVANPNHAPLPRLKGEENGRILRTEAAGPSGWNAAILDLLDRLELH